MADYLVEFGGAPHPVVRPVSWPAGERPPIAEFIASFTPAMPPTPPKSEAKVSYRCPDIALVVPPRRRPKLLDAVLERTQEEMMREHAVRMSGSPPSVSRRRAAAPRWWRIHRRVSARRNPSHAHRALPKRAEEYLLFRTLAGNGLVRGRKLYGCKLCAKVSRKTKVRRFLVPVGITFDPTRLMP